MDKETSFIETVDAFMLSETARLFERVPSAMHLADPNVALNEKYYLRHRIETIKRIWLTSQTDALALAAMVDEDYDAARWWSKYIYQELNHDILYLKDLEKHGVSVQDVANTPCFPSTIATVNYMKNLLPVLGSMVVVAYSVWVEWNSDKTSAIVVDRAAEKFSRRHVKGAHAHVGIDVNEDHYQIMLKVVYQLIQRSGGDELPFFNVMRQMTDFIGDYFYELEQECPLESSNDVVESAVYGNTFVA